MVRLGNLPQLQPGTGDSSRIVTGKTVFYVGLAIAIVGLSLATLRVDPLILAGGIIGIVALFAVLKYPFFGFFVYMALYFIRPGERYPSLAPLRLELLFGLLLLATIVLSDALRGTRVRFPTDRISMVVFGLIGVFCIGTVFSEWKAQSAELVGHFVKLFIFYYYILALTNTERRFAYAYWFIVAFTCLVGIEAFYNYFTGNFRFNQGVMRTGGATSYGDHANSMAMYMATTIPMLVYLIARYKNVLIRWLCLLLIIICFITLIITASRSGLLCIIAVALTYIGFSKHRVAYFVCLVLVSVCTWALMPEQYKMRYSSITSSQLDDSSQGRVEAWKVGLDMFLEKPILGVGPGVFPAAYWNRRGVWLQSHSLYIQVMAETGAVGILAFATLLIVIFKRLNTMFRSDPTKRSSDDLKVFARANYAILIGLLVAGVFGHIMLRDTWYLTAALIVAKTNLLPQEAGLT